MTIICALTDGERTWIGSDEHGTSGNLIAPSVPKWIGIGEWLVGAAGEARTSTLLQALDAVDGEGAHALAERIRLHLKAHDYQTTTEPGCPGYGADFLLARPGEVWHVCSGFSVALAPAGSFWAEGSGREAALGAAHALLTYRTVARHEPTGEEVVKAAVAAAIHHRIDCHGEPQVRVLEPAQRLTAVGD